MSTKRKSLRDMFAAGGSQQDTRQASLLTSSYTLYHLSFKRLLDRRFVDSVRRQSCRSRRQCWRPGESTAARSPNVPYVAEPVRITKHVQCDRTRV